MLLHIGEGTLVRAENVVGFFDIDGDVTPEDTRAFLRQAEAEGVVELLTTPLDLAGYKTAITEALYKGTKRNIESESDPKNAAVE